MILVTRMLSLALSRSWRQDLGWNQGTNRPHALWGLAAEPFPSLLQLLGLAPRLLPTVMPPPISHLQGHLWLAVRTHLGTRIFSPQILSLTTSTKTLPYGGEFRVPEIRGPYPVGATSSFTIPKPFLPQWSSGLGRYPTRCLPEARGTVLLQHCLSAPSGTFLVPSFFFGFSFVQQSGRSRERDGENARPGTGDSENHQVGGAPCPTAGP